VRSCVYADDGEGDGMQARWPPLQYYRPYIYTDDGEGDGVGSGGLDSTSAVVDGVWSGLVWSGYANSAVMAPCETRRKLLACPSHNEAACHRWIGVTVTHIVVVLLSHCM
jgi:hypothetical protein